MPLVAPKLTILQIRLIEEAGKTGFFTYTKEFGYREFEHLQRRGLLRLHSASRGKLDGIHSPKVKTVYKLTGLGQQIAAIIREAREGVSGEKEFKDRVNREAADLL